MNALIIDLTHSGFIIALELSKSRLNSQFDEIWAWDIYNTLNKDQKEILKDHGIKLINELPDQKERENLKIIAPVHCPLDLEIDSTHHQIVKHILEPWKKKKNLPVVEITGVKGKTSTAGILKEILSPQSPLILSSLGAVISQNGSDIILKKDISITPASIIETINLAENQNCDDYDTDYGICIFESSLGGTGLADVGILTNIAEDYPIGREKSSASIAKKQIFQSKMVCCDQETFNEFYLNEFSNAKDLEDIQNKINTFSLSSSLKPSLISSQKKDFNDINPGKNGNITLNANLIAENIRYGLEKTTIQLKMENLKTLNQKVLNCSFPITTFAPAPHHVSNVLAAVCAALTLDIKIEQIQKGLIKFSGLNGRSSIKIKNKTTIIEEINPGINVKAIENTIEMAKNMNNSMVILGGQYGITCEEIDETKTAQYLDSLTEGLKLILTDELGEGICKKMEKTPFFISNPQKAIEYAQREGAENIIFIYRSNYSNLKLR